jgi:hypothetical protein
VKREQLDDLSSILNDSCSELGRSIGIISDLSGKILARVGDEEALPPPARLMLERDGLRRVALALDDTPEHCPPPDQTGGIHLFFARTGRFVLALGTFGDLPGRLHTVGRNTIRQIHAHLDSLRRERRRRFLGYRLITRVRDKPHIMSIEVKSHLESLCDDLMDLEEALESGDDPAPILHHFRETLDELVAWPKGRGENFQMSLENLRASTQDLRADELTTDHVQAMIGGLELSIESWVLP